MKKLLISILTVLLLALCIITIWKGIVVFGVNIIGFTQIGEKSAKLDESISKATVIASTDFDNIVNKDLVNDLKKLKEEKKNYDDLVQATGTTGLQTTSQYQKYEIEYLWTVIGNHATSEGVVIKMDLVAGSLQNNYNLNFTVTGEYIGITDFISDIENDAALGFKIENFNLVPGSNTSELQATFTCRDIEIKDIASGSSTKADTDTSKKEDSKSTSSSTNTTADSSKGASTGNQTSDVKSNTTNTSTNATSTNTASNSTTATNSTTSSTAAN